MTEQTVAGDLLVWLRTTIEGDKVAAHEAADNDSGSWFMGRKSNVYRAEDEARYDQDYLGEVNRLVVEGNIKDQSEHIALHDPRDVIADCEAKLAILNEHATTIYPNGWGSRRTHYWCQTCDVPGDQPAYSYCRTLRLLITGYQHRPGFRPEWGSGG